MKKERASVRRRRKRDDARQRARGSLDAGSLLYSNGQDARRVFRNYLRHHAEEELKRINAIEAKL